MIRRKYLVFKTAVALLHEESVLVHVTSPEDADRFRADVFKLIPEDLVGDLLSFTWPGRDTTPD